MRNPININMDHRQNHAIRQEIGERLRVHLKAEPELPASLKEEVDKLRALDGQPPSVVPTQEHALRSKPIKGRGDRSRLLGWWLKR